jgi:anaerobic ribonucleoside-triphosphate reductase activating protein
VVWSQGCSLGCAGCFNPETHDAEASGTWMPIDGLVEDVLAEATVRGAEPAIEGVTLTGGEPLQQPEAVEAFCRQVRERSDLGIIVLTGYTRREIEADPARRPAVAHADLVVAGRYRASQRLAAGLQGSANKEVWCLTERYSPAELHAVPEVEVVLAPDGRVTVTGMPDDVGEVVGQ